MTEEELNKEKWLTKISNESSTCSTLRLLYEIIQWDENEADSELNIIANELLKRADNKLLLLSIKLFLTCILVMNISVSYHEKYFVFDEDEKEVRRMLISYFLTHLVFSLFIFIVVPTLILKSIVFLIYFLPTVILSLNIFKPLYKKLRRNSTANSTSRASGKLS